MSKRIGNLPANINIMNPVPNKDAKRIEKLIRTGGKISGYQLSDGTVLSKAEGVALAKQGGIRGVAIASRNGNEYLRSLPDAGGDLLRRQLAGQHHAFKSEGGQRPHPRRCVAGALRGGMEGHFGRRRVDGGRQTEILHDEGIHPTGAGFLGAGERIREFLLPHQRVQREVNRHTTKMTLPDDVRECHTSEIIGVLTGVEFPDAEVDGVSPRAQGGGQHLGGCYRRQQFGAFHQ